MSWRSLLLAIAMTGGVAGLSCAAQESGPAETPGAETQEGAEQPSETQSAETPPARAEGAAAEGAAAEGAAAEAARDAAAAHADSEKADPQDAHAHEENHAAADAHGAAHGAHHEDPDLSHQNASLQLEDPSEFRHDLAIWTFVLFLLLLALLTKFAWRPVMDGLEKREASIAALIEEAKANAQRSAELMKQHEARLNAAADEVHAMIASGKREAETLREQILSDAQSAAQRERDRAIADIQAAKSTALHEMTQRSVDIAFQLANGIVRRQLNPEDHDKLIRETLDRFQNVNS